jgi:putative serine protease PepD
MTLLDDQPNQLQVPHRTWRDLPASPPVADLVPPTTPGMPMPPPPTGEGFTPPMSPAPPAPRSRKRRNVFVALIAVLLGVAAVGVVAFVVSGRDDSAGATTSVVPSSESGTPAAIAAALGPAVVQIEIGPGIGSGVIYDTSGLILMA